MNGGAACGGQQTMLNGGNNVSAAYNYGNNNTRPANDTNGSNALKRKKDSFVPKPPPTLPKPKFILPQSSTTNMVLQRNLKAKSELNIATTTANHNSSSSASSTSSQLDTINGTHQEKSSVHSQLTHQHPHHQQQQQHQMVAPIRNKFLENNSIVSSSQGYHSDTWESQSSRQSFNDMNSTAEKQPVVAGTVTGIAKRYAQRIESKLAKTTVLNNGNNGSINGTPQIHHHNQQMNAATAETLVSSNTNSDDNESIPNESAAVGGCAAAAATTTTTVPVGQANHHQYYNVQTKSILIQKPPTSSSSTVSTSSNSSSSSGSGGGVFSSGQTTFSTTSSNCFSSNMMDSPNAINNGHHQHHQADFGLQHHQVNDTSNSTNVDNMNSTLCTSGVNGGGGGITQCGNVTINGSPSCLGKIVNESIELPIYYQPSSEKLSNENSFDQDDCSLSQPTKNSRYSDLYEQLKLTNLGLKKHAFDLKKNYLSRSLFLNEALFCLLPF
jgi:hypothetical protein